MVDYLDRLAIPIPDYPIDESTLERIAAEQLLKLTIERLDAAVAKIGEEVTRDTFPLAWDAMAERVYASIKAKGGAEKDRNDGEMIALMHAELSEVLEALRKDNPPSEKIQGFSEVEEELADVVLWIMGFSVLRGYRVGSALVAKHTYNIPRPYKHGKKF